MWVDVDGKSRMMKRSNSESSIPAKGHDRGRLASDDQGSKRKMSSKVSRSEVPLAKGGTGNPNTVHRKKAQDATDVKVKYCTSLQVHQKRLSSTNNAKGHFKESSNKGNAPSQILSPPEAEVQKGVSAGEKCNRLKELAKELRAVVQDTRLCGNTSEGVARCEEVLLQLSQAWLECKSATLLQQKEGAHKDAELVGSAGEAALKEFTDELLFILATSELQEAQRLALCLLSASTGSRKSYLSEMPTLQQHDPSRDKGGVCDKPTGSQLPTDPNVWQALSHLLKQQGRLPEAALLLHLLNPAQYSASCHHFLPHLLPILLDLAQRNVPPIAHNMFHHVADPYDSPFHSRLRLFGDSLKPRALALMMMSRLLAVVDGVTRLQACKHVLFPNVNALPCLLQSLDCAPSLDERAAAAFILTTCMQADNICRQHIVTHVKLTTVVALLQHSASNTSAFQTSVNFVTELLRTRYMHVPILVLQQDEEEEEEEEESAVVVEWDERVARALMRQAGGRLVSGALANGLRSSMAEVRKACLLVAAWLSSHLSKMHRLDQTQYKVCKFMSATAKERMREALQAQLQEIAAVNSGSAIVERVFAALALQNLAT